MVINLCLDSTRGLPTVYVATKLPIVAHLNEHSRIKAINLLSAKYVPPEWSSSINVLYQQELQLVNKRKHLINSYRNQFESMLTIEEAETYIKQQMPEYLV